MADVVVDHAAVERLGAGPDSPVGRHLLRLATDVAEAARRDAPVLSGALAASIGVAPLPGAVTVFAVGSDLPYALYIERRTGFLSGALAEVVR